MNTNNVPATMTATRNIIRNKFKKARTSRIERENDVKPHTAIMQRGQRRRRRQYRDLESKNILLKSTIDSPPPPPPLPPLSQLHLATKSQSIDLDTLCNNLRRLLLHSSSLHIKDANRMRQINTILDELRERKIIL